MKTAARQTAVPGMCLMLAMTCVSEAAGPGMSFLQNDQIKVGVDLNLGGAITWLSGGDGVNRVNNFDHGRQIQLSYYSGPVPFEAAGQKPAEHWRHLGWNPVQAGDDFHHGSRTVEHRNDGRELYVKCVPLQWPLSHVPAECTLESWLQLDGPVVKARARLVNARADRTPYPARLQELPALYANAAFHRVVSYTGAHPFTNAAAQVVPKSTTKHPWSFWAGTEQWSALLDEQNQGLGLITPGRIWFTGGFAGRPGGHDTRATDTGYLAGQGLEILDHNIVHEFRYEVVVGSLEQIRARARTHATDAPPSWTFTDDRQGWHYRDAHDQGWPVQGALEVMPAGPDPQMLSPMRFWRAEEAPVVIVEAAFQTGETAATLYWRKLDSPAPGAEDHIRFPVQSDGEFHRHVVRLSGCASYTGPMVQLRLDPVSKGKTDARVRVRSVRLCREEP
ncbi:MAG: hypothetical protein HS117_04070 [Verrucomicrobiaceae bacterium]|nr:hypothetical protein [Verrucomicrobiaceae bacterium]